VTSKGKIIRRGFRLLEKLSLSPGRNFYLESEAECGFFCSAITLSVLLKISLKYCITEWSFFFLTKPDLHSYNIYKIKYITFTVIQYSLVSNFIH